MAYRIYNGGHPISASAPGWAHMRERGLEWMVEYRNLNPRTALPWQSFKHKWFATKAEAEGWIARNSDLHGEQRKRPAHPRSKAERLAIAKELARRRAFASKQQRNPLGMFHAK